MMRCRGMVVGLCVAGLTSTAPLKAQEEEGAGEGEGRHMLAFFAGNNWIPDWRTSPAGEELSLIAPAFGLDYEYHLSEAWALGTYNDVAILNFVVEEEHGEFVERENTLLLTIGGSCRFSEHMKVELSAGVETEAHETLKAGRIAYEYSFELPDRWELALAANYVLKDLYSVIGAGLVIAKHFGR